MIKNLPYEEITFEANTVQYDVAYMSTRVSYFVKFPVRRFIFELEPKLLSVYDIRT